MTQNIPIGDIHFADIPQGDYLLVPVSRELVAKNPDKYEAWYPIGICQSHEIGSDQ